MHVESKLIVNKKRKALEDKGIVQSLIKTIYTFSEEKARIHEILQVLIYLI